MKRYIDADEFKLPCTAGDCYECIFFSLNKCIMKEHINNNVITEDVTEVIRCKDCEYYKSDGGKIGLMVCTLFDWYVNDNDDYCSHGKRKDK